MMNISRYLIGHTSLVIGRVMRKLMMGGVSFGGIRNSSAPIATLKEDPSETRMVNRWSHDPRSRDRCHSEQRFLII